MTSSDRYPIWLPRNAFSPRERARAGDLWRACQDVVVHASTAQGWPPERYREAGTSFVVRAMTVVHARETSYGEAILGRTWPAKVRREMLFTREVRLEGADGSALLRATQEWVHVAKDLSLARGGPELLAAFVPETIEPSVSLPSYEAIEGAPVHAFEFVCWHGWMDPLGHVNHPQYVDFCDEAVQQVLARRGVYPQRLVPRAEECTFKTAVGADMHVRVESRLVGRTEDALGAVITHRVLGNGELAATATTIRALSDGAPRELESALSVV